MHTQYEAKVRYPRHLGGKELGALGGPGSPGSLGKNLDGTRKWRIAQGSSMSLNLFLHSTSITHPTTALSGQLLSVTPCNSCSTRVSRLPLVPENHSVCISSYLPPKPRILLLAPIITLSLPLLLLLLPLLFFTSSPSGHTYYLGHRQPPPLKYFILI